MKSAIVTGAAGFVGRALVAELCKQGVQVLAVARNHTKLPLHPLVMPITLDLAELSHLPAYTSQSWDVFYHLAWAGTAGEDRRNLEVQLANVHAAAEAVEVAKQLGCRSFVGAGSIMEQELLAATAEPQVRPGKNFIYSAAKLAARQISRCVAAEQSIDHIWAVLTNAYGEGEESPRLLNTTLRKILAGEPLHFSAATQNYDFVHVEDAARALRLLGERGTPFAAYTIGSGNARPLREFLQELCKAAAPQCEPAFGAIPFEGVSLPLAAFDTTPLHLDTGFTPSISFAVGVARTMQWLRQTAEIHKEG